MATREVSWGKSGFGAFHEQREIIGMHSSECVATNTGFCPTTHCYDEFCPGCRRERGLKSVGHSDRPQEAAELIVKMYALLNGSGSLYEDDNKKTSTASIETFSQAKSEPIDLSKYMGKKSLWADDYKETTAANKGNQNVNTIGEYTLKPNDMNKDSIIITADDILTTHAVLENGGTNGCIKQTVTNKQQLANGSVKCAVTENKVTNGDINKNAGGKKSATKKVSTRSGNSLAWRSMWTEDDQFIQQMSKRSLWS